MRATDEIQHWYSSSELSQNLEFKFRNITLITLTSDADILWKFELLWIDIDIFENSFQAKSVVRDINSDLESK